MIQSQRTPAPRRLGVLLDFINSVDRQDYAREGINEAFASKRSALEFLRGRKLLLRGETLSAPDLDRLRTLRESLRMLLASNNGHGGGGGAWRALDAEIEKARFALTFHRVGNDSTATVSADGEGVTRLAAMMIGQLYDALAHGDFTRLKACGSGACLWAFYDASKNSSALWCSMTTCGNRAKAQRHRRRATQ